jgi:16S rRNA (adenine1518-N6/adenine1519-N6)-dimethyltransferase
MPSFFDHRISLGQNFLTNPEVLRRSLEAGELGPDDVVLEIGPGQGALTKLLIASPCRFVHAVEIDRRLEEWLAPLEQSHSDRFCLTWRDALSCDFASLSPKPIKVLANIPYNITTDLIWKILTELAPLGLQRLILLIQKEAAERLRAKEHTKDRGPLGVTIEVMGAISPLMNVSPGSFTPPPNVWSQLISIEITQERNLAADPKWRGLLAAAFAQRRKKLVNNLLRAGFQQAVIESSFSFAQIPAGTRAEELTCSQWLDLYKFLSRGK